jgi:23S rRNA pseudouridine2605 synthase
MKNAHGEANVMSDKIRIQKYLSEVGVASRRAVEAMLREGRIEVNGQFVVDLPCFVQPETDRIFVDGVRISPRRRTARKVYFLLHKPRRVVCTSSDPEGRRRAIDYLPPGVGRVYCVGRLDADSTGLILLTNDGELTQHLTHPSCGVPKTYVVTVDGRIGEAELEKIKRGVHLDGRRTRRASVKLLRRAGTQTLLEIRLREGRNREIRRMLLRLGHKVRRLKRVAIGPINDRGLSPGSVRELTAREVALLRRAGRDQE